MIEEGVLPATVAQAAHVRVTRVEPEIFVPPRPGQEAARATGVDRDQALFFDKMERRLPIGLSRDGEPVFANLDFLDGTRGAHVNISGISGVATKTTYATFLLHGLFTSGALGGRAANTHGIIFNVKGEDLLFVDQPNRGLDAEARAEYAKLGLPVTPFERVQIVAPVRKGSRERLPDTGSRQEGITAFFWTLREFVEERLLAVPVRRGRRFLEPARVRPRSGGGQAPPGRRGRGQAADPWIAIDGQRIESFDALVEVLTDRGPDGENRSRTEQWAGFAAAGTVAAFERRLARRGAARRATWSAGQDVGRREQHRLDWRERTDHGHRHPRPARPREAVRGGRRS